MTYKFGTFQTLLSHLAFMVGLITTSTVLAQEDAVILARGTITCNFSRGNSPSTTPVDLVLRVNLTTGMRSVISVTTCDELASDNHNPIRRDNGWNGNIGAAIESSGSIIVASWDSLYTGKTIFSAIYRVDPSTGTRKLLSDFNDQTQQADSGYVDYHEGSDFPNDIAIDKSGHILAAAGHLLFSIDPHNGNRTVLIRADTYYGDTFRSLAISPASGLIFVDGILTKQISGNPIAYDLFTVDPGTGLRIPLSNSRDTSQGPLGRLGSAKLWWFGNRALIRNPVTVDATGQVFRILRTTDATNPSIVNRYSALFSIDAVSGFRTLVSDFGNAQQGRLIDYPIAMTVTRSGQLLVLDNGGNENGGATIEGTGALVAVDPATGNRTVISDFSNPAQGPGANPTALAVGNIHASTNGPGPGTSGTRPVFTFTASSNSAQIGQAIVYTATFNNDGPTSASKVRLSDNLSKKTKWVSTSATGGTCKGKTTIACNFGTVQAGAAVSATITVLAKKSGVVKNKALMKYATPKKAGSVKLQAHTQTATVQTTVTP